MRRSRLANSRVADVVLGGMMWCVIAFLALGLVAWVFLLSVWVWWQVTGWW